MLGSGLLELLDELQRVLDQGHEGTGHQIQAQEEQQVPLLLQERSSQSLGKFFLAFNEEIRKKTCVESILMSFESSVKPCVYVLPSIVRTGIEICVDRNMLQLRTNNRAHLSVNRF